MNLAIVSPRDNAYSESFIQAHKNFIEARVFYYYGNRIPTHLDGESLLSNIGVVTKVSRKLRQIIFHQTGENIFEQAFERSLVKNKINVVLAEYGPTGAELTPICKKLNIPLLVHFHGYDAYSKETLRNYARAYDEMFAYAKTVFAVSRDMLKRLQELGCPPEKLILNTYGPNPEFFNVSSDFRAKKLVSVGRFVDKKAPYFTLLAFQKVLKTHPDARLYMAGDGVLLNTCQNLVSYFNLSESVFFPGVINRQQFIEHLGNASGFIQHSITAENGDSEGTPVAIIEAQAAGIPVISTRHAGIPDVVQHGETGFLVEEGDVDGMAEKISGLLSNLSNARLMGKAAKSHISKNFTLDAHISNIIKRL